MNILSELLIIEKLSISKEERIALTRKVFEDHETEIETFERTRDLRMKDPEFWKRVYKSTTDLIKIKQSRYQPEKMSKN